MRYKENETGTFGKASEMWLEAVRPKLKESSMVKYRNIIRVHLLPYFNGRSMAELDRRDILSFCESLLYPGDGNDAKLAPKTTADIMAVLKAIYRFSAKSGSFENGISEWPSISQPRHPLKVLSQTEQGRLSAYLVQHPTLSNLGILFCLYTGIRIGEICALRWADISTEERSVQIRRTMQRIQRNRQEGAKTEILISSPKSDSSVRKIPLPEELSRLICGYRQSDGSFFLTGSENRYMEPRTLQNRFKTVISACGIPAANFHCLRHTFATRCVELGFDIKSLSEILGHASVDITLNRYVHPSLEQKRKNMNLLSMYFPSRQQIKDAAGADGDPD